MRSQLEDAPEGLRIIIPARREWELLWGTIWLGVLVYTGNDFLFGPQEKEWHFSLNFPSFWFFSISAWIVFSHISNWLWVLGGKEIIEITSGTLTTRRDYFGIGFTHRFPLKDVHDLQYVPSEKKGRARIPEGIGFNYRGKLRRFGDGLQEAEVSQLLRTLQQRATTIGLSHRGEAIA